MAIEQPFVVANGALGDPTELRSLLEVHSYLYFSRLVPEEPILTARRDILELCHGAGWLDPAAPLLDGVWNGEAAHIEGEPAYMAVYRQVLQLPSFLELPHHPTLLTLAERVLGGAVLVHPRKIGRITFPTRQEETTPPHQDHPLIKGTAQTYTLWMPLGDCPRSLGGLAILPGSHRPGLQQHVPMRGTGGTGVVLGTDLEWHSGDMEIGDCLLFYSHTIHKALLNVSGEYLRISVDDRYQLESDEVDPGSLKPHYADWFAERGQPLEIGKWPTSSQAAPPLSRGDVG